MGWLRPVFWLLVIAIVGAFLHYHLPRRDVVRILANEIIRVDYETTNAQGETVTRTRDIRQIYAETPDGETMEFNNVDAPLYLKFDSANLTAKAEQFSGDGPPKWAVMTYYGWRIEFISWFPNAIAIRQAEGPDEDLFPWLNITILTIAVVLILVGRRMLILAIERFTDPVSERYEEDHPEERGLLGRVTWRLRKALFGTRG